jgi:trans-2,3-dihydro-3-hydroxyanthranilate isomerase
MQVAGVDNAYLYTPGDGADYQARMYSPTAGIPEDPATGSAVAILSAQLWASGALGQGEASLTVVQGVEMGRRSEIGLTVTCNESGVQRAKVQGSAVRISEGRIRIPD